MNRRAATRLRGGHVWAYRSDVVEARAGAGQWVHVVDERRLLLGCGFYSSSSQIAVRLFTTYAAEANAVAPLIEARLEAALAFRRRVVTGSDSFRVVFSEADQLPGLVIDKYNDVVTFQALTQAWDRPELRELVVATVRRLLQPGAIVERVDARIRELEELPAAETRLVFGESTQTVVTLNGLQFGFDATGGQKTGAFLDQRENYAAAERWAHGQALDICTYQGGFALHLARVCTQVTAVDASRAALEVAEANEQRNAAHRIGPEVEWIEGNAFDLLKDYAAAGAQYDTVVLDPPAFAKSKRAVETALRGYKELNLRALKMLRPGGVLVTCSCSHHVSAAEFMAMVAEAASDARRRVRVLERRGAALDHPEVLTIPETAYLKCVIVQAE